MTIDMFSPSIAPPSAVISECGRYRYRLDRTWSAGLPRICWIMCNPSTADASVDDPTIRKITGYARKWGYGSLVVVNLWAWRATDPSALPFGSDHVVGPENDHHINAALAESVKVVCAWGCSVHARHRSPRESHVIGRIQCAGHMTMALKINADGSPAHPLYQPGAADLVVMPW